MTEQEVPTLFAWAGVRRTKTEASVVTADGKKLVVALPANTGSRPSVAYDRVNDLFVIVYRESGAITCEMVDRI